MRILDLFCGAGGCAMGYHRAGFEVVGVDINPQPNYPFQFFQGDALEFAEKWAWHFDAIHASPPCQAYTCARHMNGRQHPDLVAPTRKILVASGKVWVIENVPGAPMPNAKVCCGLALATLVKRHRLFESNVPISFPPCPEGHRGEWYTVFGDGGSKAKQGRKRDAKGEIARRAMGIGWMNRKELSQAIPPAYTEYIGRQLIEYLAQRATA